ncbi:MULTISPECIES: cysteine desulfurase family protein [Empedobacter]|uniref:Cysteine desulfurase n=2 Tax=Empedobacter TaxID=59734 RepID=A0A3R8SR63_9FLAO|nr:MULTISPECIES: cysteine desulfurase family protein [Empedobacter]MBW1618942.1 cysteine desulfurase [Empedobacter falsenii]MDH0660400.1 cysteine desulfurase [Empedobacter sp. GD03865]MDH1603134.1 cysteine desulfurase [Empedobacter sp. GD03739]MDM1139467.1 cysteine desulfurase [Empedobacter sp. R132-2]RRT90010.1 cysteine desulfurase [Empedobacter falsenii]
MQRVYLDNAATTAIRPEVVDEMANVMKNVFGNPSSTHVFGREAKALIEMARKNIAQRLNISPAEIYFTSCGTESNNTIIRSCVNDLDVTRIITSDMEHKCVQESIKDLEYRGKVEVIRINIQKNGDIDYAQLEELVKDQSKKTLVSLMHANNEIGNLTDIKRISQLCQENNTLFHTDTVQTVGHYDLDFQDLGMDFASCSAHKIHGPKGAGFLYAKKASHLKALIAGGGQERGMRSGTENVYGIVGLSKAFDLAIDELEAHVNHIKEIKQYTIDQLKAAIPGVSFNGLSDDLDKSLYALLSIKLPFHDALIGFELELAGIAVSQGSACSSGAAKVSLVMQTLYTEEEIDQMTPLRVSFSYETTKEDIDVLVGTLKKIAEKHQLQNA